MKVQLIANTFSEENGYLRYGEVVDVSDDTAERWIKNKIASAHVAIPKSAKAIVSEVAETPAEAQSDGQNEPELAVADEAPRDINTEELIDIRTLDSTDVEDLTNLSREGLEAAAEALGIKVTKAMKNDTIIKKLGEAKNND